MMLASFEQEYFMDMAKFIIGGLVGSFLGFLYYKLVGCSSGTCPITSSPVHSSIYGGALGVLLSGQF
jgi:hypothetical protein